MQHGDMLPDLAKQDWLNQAETILSLTLHSDSRLFAIPRSKEHIYAISITSNVKMQDYLEE